MRHPARVLLADDQAKVRSALRLMIEQEPGFRVVGEAAFSRCVAALHRQRYTQMVLLDWELPGLPEHHRLDMVRTD